MLKKCRSSGEYPFRSSHDHRFRFLLHVHLERKETCEYEIVDVPGIVKTGRNSLRLTPVMIGNHQSLSSIFPQHTERLSLLIIRHTVLGSERRYAVEELESYISEGSVSHIIVWTVYCTCIT